MAINIDIVILLSHDMEHNDIIVYARINLIWQMNCRMEVKLEIFRKITWLNMNYLTRETRNNVQIWKYFGFHLMIKETHNLKE